MKPNDNDVKIITNIIDFMVEHKAPEILYARAIDSTTVVLLRIWLEHETIDMLQHMQSHIIDANATNDEKTFVTNILKYLGEHDTTGMTYSTKLSSGNAKVCVELTQMETPIKSESEG
jgi:hypothetical protein